MSNFSKVGTFMKTFGQEVKREPSFSTDKINKLRIDLIREELDELTDAMNKKDLFAPITGIIIGLVLIISPFLAHVKKSLILLGIVPLWIGAYYIYHLSHNLNKKKSNDEDGS